MKKMTAQSRVLACDRAGNPNGWLSNEVAVHLVATNRVLAALGEHARIVYGGINALSRRRSSIRLSSILLTNARVQGRRWQNDYAPPLTNKALFARDDHLCLYCGQSFKATELTRDHVVPVSRGGRDCWSNVASACRDCNHRKNDRSPEEWGVELIAVPYTPCHAEHLLLNGRTILADQKAFLTARLRRR